MIISVNDLRTQVSGITTTDEQIAVRLESIEGVIRRYTNNNFQIRDARFTGRSEDNYVYGSPRFITVGDTVQISGSGVNDGLYIVTVVDDDHIEVDKPLMPVGYNIVTKVSYPAEVVQCAVDMFRWHNSMGSKVGIKSETLSRHSVTYEDSGSLFMGYPTGILSGLRLFKKARC